MKRIFLPIIPNNRRRPNFSALVTAALLCSLPLLLPDCRKPAVDRREAETADLMAKAHAYISSDILTRAPVYQPGNPRNERTQRARDIVWSSATVMTFRGRPAVIAPVHFLKDIFLRTSWGGNNNFRLDNQEKLLAYRDSSQTWHVELVTTLPDTNYLRSDRHQFSGLILVDDWWGNPINKYHFSPDGRVERFVSSRDQDASVTPKEMATKVTTDVMIQICSYISGYNYAVGAEDDGEYWEEFVGCTFMYAPDEGGGGGGGSGYNGVDAGGGDGASQPMIYAPTHIIADIKLYLKCFQNIAGATFQVTVCVDQPTPGSRNPWSVSFTDGSSGSGASGAGHVYLILSEKMPGGWSITRNVGFYPSSSVWPTTPPVPGVLNDDENTHFNIAGQYNINSTEFFAMLQFIIGASSDKYQVNTYNCTNFALDALDAGHIYLPRTIGYWLGGMGVDPGDLGEDIRGFNFTGMTRFTSPFLHANLGSCN